MLLEETENTSCNMAGHWIRELFLYLVDQSKVYPLEQGNQRGKTEKLLDALTVFHIYNVFFSRQVYFYFIS